MSKNKKQKAIHRDFIAKDLMTNKYRQRVVPNKKKTLKKFDWKKQKDDDRIIDVLMVVSSSFCFVILYSTKTAF